MKCVILAGGLGTRFSEETDNKPKPMTLFYRTHSWSREPQITDETKKLCKHIATKANWRITQLPNGFFQTEYQDDDN